MRRFRTITLLLLACLVPAAPARAADPILPLAEVRAGMQCQGLTVVKGVEPVPFGAEILDVVEGEPGADGPRILVRVFGSAVDETGVGPGFSGSPIYCGDRRGRAANVGAISESVGEYGGKVLLATPIEAILGNRARAPQAKRRASVTRRARSLAGPLTISGLSSPLARGLTRAAARRGRAIIAAPSGPLRSFPPQVLRAGSAMGVGYSSGDITVGAVGTVAYVDDARRVWGFGHPLDGVGARSLLLQDAYVYRVISNPVQLAELSTYKLAAASHTVGSLTNDANSAVVGRLGSAPRTIPVRAAARDDDTGARQRLRSDVADETDVDEPLGSPLVSFIAPLAVTQAASAVLRSAPGKTSGRACIAIRVREIRGRLRFCNRYVGETPGFADIGLVNAVASGAGTDAAEALSLIGGYTSQALHVTSVDARVRVHRGADLAYLRSMKLPKRVRPGQRVTARLVIQRLRGARSVRRVPVRIPGNVRRGSRRIILEGTDADFPELGFSDELIFEFTEEDDEDSESKDGSALDAGPQSKRALRRAVKKLGRYDGVRLYVGKVRGSGRKAYRDPDIRLAGRVSARVKVIRPREDDAG